MRKKRLVSAVLALALTLSLAGCNASARQEQPAAPAAPAQESAPAAPAAPEAQSAPVREEAPAASPLVLAARYPAMAQYPNLQDYARADGSTDWAAYSAAEDVWQQGRAAAGEAWGRLPDGALDGFLAAGIPAFLSGAAGENRICSPLNLYMALSMAAELCDGESRAQLLALLGADDIETVRERADTLWTAVYRDDGVSSCVLAGSLWMRDGVPFRKDTVRTLCDVYRASSFRGDMEDPLYQQALRDWLSEQTGGQLREAAENVALSPETVLELLTTVYFRAKWLAPFDAENTSPDVFHAPDGDVTCDFLHEEWADFWVYRGARFTAAQRTFEGAGEMWFLLPDEGVSPEELLADPEALAFLAAGGTEDAEWYFGKLTLPKFDISSELELSDALRALGVTDVFDAAHADFSPLLEDAGGAALSGIQHAARVAMDEEGVTATAFTAMGYGAGAPVLEMDFTLDRPFLFQIADGRAPLFVGIVNQP